MSATRVIAPISPELKQVLRTLKVGKMLNTLPYYPHHVSLTRTLARESSDEEIIERFRGDHRSVARERIRLPPSFDARPANFYRTRACAEDQGMIRVR
jgi:hypothetical protein